MTQSPSDQTLHRPAGGGLPVFEPMIGPNLRRSSPHLIDWAEFEQQFGTSDIRAALIASLGAHLAHLKGSGLTLEAAMIGGSFTTETPAPGDIDALLSYRIAQEAEIERAVAAMGEKVEGLDIRFVPIDGDATISMKVIAFFATPYSFDKNGSGQMRPLIVVRL